MTFQHYKTIGFITEVDSQWSVFVDGNFINTFSTEAEAVEVMVFLQAALDFARGYASE